MIKNVSEAIDCSGVKKTALRRLSVAPMMEYTDKHCRYFLRLITQHTLLYSEMVTTGALLHGCRSDLLDFSATEQPVALQLGGSDPQALALCAIMAQKRGYKEINLNVGCPSNRVQEGNIGACLMAKPELIASCVKAIQQCVKIPVTIKHRIGVKSSTQGHYMGYERLKYFVEATASAGCKSFIIHARIAILEGLTPKENRSIPPLEYDKVYQLKQDYPELEIIINGGIKTISEAKHHLRYVDGVMIGREAYHNPYILCEADKIIFQDQEASMPTRIQVATAMIPYIKRQLEQGVRLHQITRHMLGLFNGLPGARYFRRLLSEQCRQKTADITTYETVLAQCFSSKLIACHKC